MLAFESDEAKACVQVQISHGPKNKTWNTDFLSHTDREDHDYVILWITCVSCHCFKTTVIWIKRLLKPENTHIIPSGWRKLWNNNGVMSGPESLDLFESTYGNKVSL